MTIYPIVHAVVLARALKTLAAWKLERGSSLGALEQLMGSLSTGSILSTIYSLRSLNFLTVALVTMWALSPIGGQASLFLLGTELESVFSSDQVDYFDTNGNTTFFGADYSTVLPELNALLLSSLMTPNSIKSSNHDLWGNVKVPNLAQAGVKNSNSSGWIPVSNGPVDTISYTSLLGVAITNDSAPGNTTFLMETSYVAVTCFSITSGPPIIVMPADLNYTNGTFSLGGNYPESEGQPNVSIALNGFNGGDMSQNWGVIGSKQPAASVTDQRILLVQSRITEPVNDDQNHSDVSQVRAYCTLSNIYLTASVSCIEEICTVLAIQPSEQPPASSYFIPFAYPRHIWRIYRKLSYRYTHPSGQRRRDVFAIELYIQSPAYFSAQGGTDLASVPIEDSTRLQHVLNTY